MKPDTQKEEKLVHGVGGKGKLTAKAIKNIQGHYGGAIRNNCGNIIGMKEDIWHIYNHRSGDHTSCPNWCAVTKTGDITAANRHQLPPWLCKLIRPVFVKHSADKLLKKCLHGGTQNANESFHSVIWSRYPKEKFAGRSRVELAVADATVTFNDGQAARVDIFRQAGLTIGRHQSNYAQTVDRDCVQRSFAAKSSGSATTTADSASYYEAGAF